MSHERTDPLASEHALAAERAAADEARRTVRRLEAVEVITEALAAATTVAEVGRAVFERGLGRLPIRVGGVSRLAAPDRLEIVYSVGATREFMSRFSTYPLSSDLPSALAARTGEPVFVESRADLLARFPAMEAILGAAEDGASVNLPLVAGDRVIGSMGFALRGDRRFDADERAYLVALARHAAPALERALLSERERAARAEEARTRALLDAIVDNAPLGIGLFDRELRFVRVNGVLAEMNGLAPEAHLGKTPRELFPGLPMDEVERAWAEVMRTGEPFVDVELSGETPAAPGRTRHWVESWYPVRAGDELVGIGALVREVTAEREAQEFQRNVMGIVSHDLRNPLSAISATAELLRMGVPPERLPVLGTRILTSAQRMARIISVLADYARVRAGQEIPLRPRACDLAALCRETVEAVGVVNPGREVRLHGDASLPGEWDPDRVGQILSNLVGNAVEHGTPETPVDVTWRAEDGAAVVEVANDGGPIAPETLSRLFEPFRRGENGTGGRVGGLGLGLFIARAIARAHLGSLEARSAPGERTTFTLRLPRRA